MILDEFVTEAMFHFRILCLFDPWIRDLMPFDPWIRDLMPFDPWIRDPGWVKNQDPDHISESLETIFWVKILQFFHSDPDPGSENIFVRIRAEHPGSYFR